MCFQTHTHTHTPHPSHRVLISLFFSIAFVNVLLLLGESAQAQLNLINLWVVQVSDHFPSQIWTSPVTLQSIKPNYSHYKDHQIPLSNPFSFPRQHRILLMQTAHVRFWFRCYLDVDYIRIVTFSHSVDKCSSLFLLCYLTIQIR